MKKETLNKEALEKIKSEMSKNMKAYSNYNITFGISIGLFIGFWLGWYAYKFLN